jgi:hypothetical protein
MEDKEIEKRLQDGADNIEVRDFSLVWKDIKPKIVPQKKKRFHWLPIAASVASVVVACSIIIPIALQPHDQPSTGDNQGAGSSEQVYFLDELFLTETTSEDFLNQLTSASINIIDINEYVITSSYLFKSPTQSVKGGRVELTDDLDLSTFYLTVDFYDKSVKIDELLNKSYDFDYSVNDAMIQYKIKETYPEDGIYIYDIRANFNSVNYFMEYTCFTEDIKPFLDEFFK